jgi:Mg2+ and Co2+ transporter CorA
MGIDIKLPIGLMFSILGLLLTIYGLLTASNPELYQKSFGINVNLWSGIVMLVFGVLLLLFVKKKSR